MQHHVESDQVAIQAIPENGHRPVVLSGIRPTGELHLGNYFGAVKHFVDLQDQPYDRMYFVADLHSLTTSVEDELDVDHSSIEVVRMFLACGVDPVRSLIYRQSDVPEIPFISLLLSMVTPEGELRRCTTYKEKVEQLRSVGKQVSAGLLIYPILMAADILFTNADLVPVGADQLQHLEIAREVARRYNHYVGHHHHFKEPRPYDLSAIRVPGLLGEGKMSKSAGGADNAVFLLDPPEEVVRKVAAAKTDAGPVKVGEMSEAMQNFYLLLKLCSPEAVYAEYAAMHARGEQKFYGKMKARLAADINTLLAPIQARYASEECSVQRVKELLQSNASSVRTRAQQTLKRMLADFGFTSLAPDSIVSGATRRSAGWGA